MTSSQAAGEDTVDLGEVAGTLRRGVRWIVLGAVLGIAAAFAAASLLRPRYEATTTVLVRESSGGASSALSQLAGLADLMPGLGGGLGGVGSSLDTEVEIMTSRNVIGQVVDSLGLQVMVLAPKGTAPRELFSHLRLDAEVTPGSYRFERDGDGYGVEGSGVAGEARPGGQVQVRGGVLTLRAAALPESFEIALVDREQAIDQVVEDLQAEEAAGQIVQLAYSAPDRATAAQVPNLMVEKYLERRRTVDRGTNQHRYEFLTEHVDSILTQLQIAEAELRAEQERTGMLDPALTGRVEVERAMVVQSELETVDLEARALESVLSQRTARNGSPRELAAYPTLFRNPAINGLLEQLFQLETQRAALLQRRTEQDEEVRALTEGIRNLEAQLVSLSRDYLNGLSEQRTALQAEMRNYQSVIGSLPAQAMQNLRRQREVRRLTETLVVLQTQLVTARLGAIGEGGDVRQVDVATPPKRASFPNLPMFLGIGLMVGLAAGTAGALGKEYLGTTVRLPQHAELATGLPALALRPGAPLLLGGLEEGRSLLIVPVGPAGGAGAVAHSLARTAAWRGTSVALVDVEQAVARLGRGASVPALTGGKEETVGVALAPLQETHEDAFPVVRAAQGEQLDPGEVRATLGRLEERLLTVVIAAGSLDSPLTMALLSASRPVVLTARAGRVTRAALREGAESLRRAGVPVAGVILHEQDGGAHTGA